MEREPACSHISSVLAVCLFVVVKFKQYKEMYTGYEKDIHDTVDNMTSLMAPPAPLPHKLFSIYVLCIGKFQCFIALYKPSTQTTVILSCHCYCYDRRIP